MPLHCCRVYRVCVFGQNDGPGVSIVSVPVFGSHSDVPSNSNRKRRQRLASSDFSPNETRSCEEAFFKETLSSPANLPSSCARDCERRRAVHENASASSHHVAAMMLVAIHRAPADADYSLRRTEAGTAPRGPAGTPGPAGRVVARARLHDAQRLEVVRVREDEDVDKGGAEHLDADEPDLQALGHILLGPLPVLVKRRVAGDHAHLE